MKILQTLLLASAAGLFAVSATHAAELQGKAKSADRAKMCRSYGAGFRYVPGSDVCVKIGGWVRAETTVRGHGSAMWDAPNNANDRTNIASPSRADITTDVRAKTEYGPVRAYFSVGVNRQ